MNTYKLKYADKTAAIDDLIDKGVIATWAFTDEEETEKNPKTYSRDTVAVVYIGRIVDTPATFTDESEIDTEVTFLDGYHVDIMTSATIEFDNEEHPTNPVHNFA
jgi:hypothetical protein